MRAVLHNIEERGRDHSASLRLATNTLRFQFPSSICESIFRAKKCNHITLSSQLLFLTHRRGQGEKDPPKPLHVFRLSTKADSTSISLSIVGPLVIRNVVCLPFVFDVVALITQNKI